MKVIKASYSKFKKAIKELHACTDAGWKIVIDLNDGEIDVKFHLSSNEMYLIHRFHLEDDFDLSDENIEGTFPPEWIANSVDWTTCGEIKCEVYHEEV